MLDRVMSTSSFHPTPKPGWAPTYHRPADETDHPAKDNVGYGQPDGILEVPLAPAREDEERPEAAETERESGEEE